jgi:hypothetical protein
VVWYAIGFAGPGEFMSEMEDYYQPTTVGEMDIDSRGRFVSRTYAHLLERFAVSSSSKPSSSRQVWQTELRKRCWESRGWP